MFYAIYERLNVHVEASNLAVIREARKMLAPEVRGARSKRAARRRFFKKIMAEHRSARALYRRHRFNVV